jgi:hypothetical protein
MRQFNWAKLPDLKTMDTVWGPVRCSHGVIVICNACAAVVAGVANARLHALTATSRAVLRTRT